MKLLAIDPGPVQSAWMIFDQSNLPARFGKTVNTDLIFSLRDGFAPFFSLDHLAIETVECFGMAVGAEVFDTCIWIGRFVECMESLRCDWTLIRRMDVKMHLCKSPRAKDANIRAALIDRFGGKDAAIGKKKSPGPLYGISADVWSALAVGLTFLETRKTK